MINNLVSPLKSLVQKKMISGSLLQSTIKTREIDWVTWLLIFFNDLEGIYFRFDAIPSVENGICYFLLAGWRWYLWIQSI